MLAHRCADCLVGVLLALQLFGDSGDLLVERFALFKVNLQLVCPEVALNGLLRKLFD